MQALLHEKYLEIFLTIEAQSDNSRGTLTCKSEKIKDKVFKDG